MVIDFPYEGLGNIPEPGFPIKMSETKGDVYRGAPRVGQHTDEVLKEYGCTQEDIDHLREKGVIR